MGSYQEGPVGHHDGRVQVYGVQFWQKDGLTRRHIGHGAVFVEGHVGVRQLFPGKCKVADVKFSCTGAVRGRSPENDRSDLLHVELGVGVVEELFDVGHVEDVRPDEDLVRGVFPPLVGGKPRRHSQPLDHEHVERGPDQRGQPPHEKNHACDDVTQRSCNSVAISRTTNFHVR